MLQKLIALSSRLKEKLKRTEASASFLFVREFNKLYYGKVVQIMILFIILLIVLLILLVAGIIILSVGGASFILIFGDVIVCAFIIVMIMKRIIRNHKD